MNAKIHSIDGTGTKPDLEDEFINGGSGGGGVDGEQYYPGASRDGRYIAGTFKLAFPWEEIRRMMIFHAVMMVLMFGIEFAASFSANWMSQRDGFGQFNGSYAGLIGISLVTACMYWVMAVLWESGKMLTKVLAGLCYVGVVGWLMVLIAPEIIPMLTRLLDGASATTSVFAGASLVTQAESSKWVLYILTAAAALLVTAPGLLFIYFKACFTMWNHRRKCHTRANDILAVSDKGEAHRNSSEELDKVVFEFSTPSESKQHIDRAMLQAINSMVQQLQARKQEAIVIINSTLSPSADKARASAEMHKIDTCIVAARAITI